MIRLSLTLLALAALITPQASMLEVEEATIADIHAALGARRITCAQLVQRYMDRIVAYDKKGPAIMGFVRGELPAGILFRTRMVGIDVDQTGVLL